MNQSDNNLNKITHKISEEGVPILERLIEKLTGKGAVITYSFNNLKIEMPKAQGHEWCKICSGSMTVNGSIRISAEVHNKNKGGPEVLRNNDITSKEDIQAYDSNNDVAR